MPNSRSYLPVDDAKAPFFVGIDLGGTNIKFGVVDCNGVTVAYHTVPTEIEKGPQEGANRMANIANQLVKKMGIPLDEFPRIGLATPGSMDVSKGLLLEPHNLPGWWNCPIRDLLSHYSGRLVTFANDANAAAYGEYWAGTGRQYASMVLMTLGTGIGGGIITNGSMIVGHHSCGGEVGHIIIDNHDDALRDNAGKPGSLEAYASASAVVKRTQMALDAKEKSSIAKRIKAGEKLTPILIAEEAEREDVLARRIIFDTAKYLGVGMASLAHTVDPECFTLGGAMTFGGSDSPLGEMFIQAIRDEFNKRVLGPLRDTVPIEFASLGGDAGFVGAAGLAKMEYEALQAQKK